MSRKALTAHQALVRGPGPAARKSTKASRSAFGGVHTPPKTEARVRPRQELVENVGKSAPFAQHAKTKPGHR